MIKEITVYTIICDRCGCDINEDESWDDTIEEAKELSKDFGWIEVKGKHYCEDCRDEINED